MTIEDLMSTEKPPINFENEPQLAFRMPPSYEESHEEKETAKRSVKYMKCNLIVSITIVLLIAIAVFAVGVCMTLRAHKKDKPEHGVWFYKGDGYRFSEYMTMDNRNHQRHHCQRRRHHWHHHWEPRRDDHHHDIWSRKSSFPPFDITNDEDVMWNITHLRELGMSFIQEYNVETQQMACYIANSADLNAPSDEDIRSMLNSILEDHIPVNNFTEIFINFVATHVTEMYSDEIKKEIEEVCADADALLQLSLDSNTASTECSGISHLLGSLSPTLNANGNLEYFYNNWCIGS